MPGRSVSSFVFFAAWLFCVSGCSVSSILSRNSVSDFSPRYSNELLLRQRNSNFLENSSLDNTWSVVSVYKKAVGKLFYSQCQNLPSDSEYLNLQLQSGCVSKPIALFSTVSRLLREQDLPKVHPHFPFLRHGHLHWIDYPKQCLSEE